MMGVYANGKILYGFVRTDDLEELFEAVIGEIDGEEEYDFEEMHSDLREKYGISMSSIGYEGVDIISAFSATASAKGMDIETIDVKDLEKTEDYRLNMLAFLREIGIDSPESYTPQWYILGYMD
jgi:hypothetical protein